MAVESKKGSFLPLDGLRYGRPGEKIGHLRRALQGTQCLGRAPGFTDRRWEVHSRKRAEYRGMC